jgi:general nucleoside transport system ATP-binding protein
VSLAVEMRGIGKSFGAVRALDDVHLGVERGTIHAVVGENGAGKTTLMRVLYGAIRADEGEFFVGGSPRSYHNSAEAIADGIGMVSQHYSIIPDITCLQNLMLGAENAWLINKTASAQRAQSLAESMGFSFDWGAPASTLSPAGAQKLEILKLLWRNSKIMILDEPTAMLSPADSDMLYASLHKLAAEGATVIVVTHRLPEVMQHCRRVTVLRGGKLITEKEVAGTTSGELAELIVGHSLAELQPRKPKPDATPLLSVRDLVVTGSRGEEALKGISFSANAGEILGIAGVDGSGQRELFGALTGDLRPKSGEIVLAGENLTSHGTRARLQSGVRLIPEDRHEEGVVETWSLEENAALGLQRQRPFSRGALVDGQGRVGAADEMAKRFNTRHGGLHMPIASLSGGNQQRFVAARALYLSPKLILAFQPARGLDIDATRNVYDAIRAECEKGAAAVVVSFDLDEILENCDRVAVMNHGRMAFPPSGQDHDRAEIGRLMVGAA